MQLQNTVNVFTFTVFTKDFLICYIINSSDRCIISINTHLKTMKGEQKDGYKTKE